MRYALKGPLKEYGNKRHRIKREPKLIDTTLITPTSINTNKTKHENKVCVYFFIK